MKDEQPSPDDNTAPSVATADTLSLAGQLLIAMPGMEDERFTRSVIYLCAHSGEGAMGIIINRPVDKPRFDDLLSQLDTPPSPPIRRIEVMEGGPMESGRGFVLHTADWSGEGTLPVQNGLSLTASLDVLKAIATGDGPSHGFLALGYASWTAGQLERELQQNAWLSAPANQTLIFETGPGDRWKGAMAQLKIDPNLLSTEAGHA
ncbi:Transcriptional regulator, algH [Granulibacter bethesdensis]|uniref:YqgE/AlgH family protein n=1 Tax=Granulibacter bethesdensis TaxID=364410 RepID=UPI00090B1D30|nr:YqgE/AlgH family protein [Granulibacter bethesdensis]APH57699.1 Transcriptional regulator, algH [Granulibacter bethesdensis]